MFNKRVDMVIKINLNKIINKINKILNKKNQIKDPNDYKN